VIQSSLFILSGALVEHLLDAFFQGEVRNPKGVEVDERNEYFNSQ